MGSMFGGSGHQTRMQVARDEQNRARQITQEKTEADRAAQLEAQRQARLASGRERIKSMFNYGNNFYDAFGQSIEDYQRPEVERQYEDAQEQNLFDLARRGLMQSTVAADRQAELAEDKALADAKVARDAAAQKANLRRRVADAQSTSLSYLNSTEDPTQATNRARTEVNQINQSAPQFDDMGSLFRAAALGYNSYDNARRGARYKDAVAGNNPYSSSGKVVG